MRCRQRWMCAWSTWARRTWARWANLWSASISTLLNPRRKTLSKQECVNCSPDVRQLAINELKDVVDMFEGSAPQQTTVSAASASAPSPASALAPAPAPPPAPAPGGDGATGEDAAGPLRYGVATRQQTCCRWECGCRWR